MIKKVIEAKLLDCDEDIQLVNLRKVNVADFLSETRAKLVDKRSLSFARKDSSNRLTTSSAIHQPIL